MPNFNNKQEFDDWIEEMKQDSIDYPENNCCDHCGIKLDNEYYSLFSSEQKLCEDCAKKEYREYFDEYEDLEELKNICDYDTEEELIQTTIEENLYKYKHFLD
jgi:hypothetical protein